MLLLHNWLGCGRTENGERTLCVCEAPTDFPSGNRETTAEGGKGRETALSVMVKIDWSQ
jgi:hypothetical protein